MKDGLDNIERVIPIDPGGKYVFMVEEGVSGSDFDRNIRTVREWWENGDPILFVRGGEIKLVRVDDE